jgi:hypothetical protein
MNLCNILPYIILRAQTHVSDRPNCAPPPSAGRRCRARACPDAGRCSSDSHRELAPLRRRVCVQQGPLGAVSFFHRFGSSLNVHPHYLVVLDGVFGEADGEIEFCEASELTPGSGVIDVNRYIT